MQPNAQSLEVRVRRRTERHLPRCVWRERLIGKGLQAEGDHHDVQHLDLSLDLNLSLNHDSNHHRDHHRDHGSGNHGTTRADDLAVHGRAGLFELREHL